MAGKKYPVTGDQYRTISRRARDILRQVDEEKGSPLDPEWVADQLQRIGESKPIILPTPTTSYLSDLPRISQAAILWGAGFGGKGMDFNTYLATIPPIPTFPADYAERFLQLVLVDTRLPLTKQCQLLGVRFDGNDETFVDFDPAKLPTQPVYWMRCQDGKKNLKKKVRTCRKEFQPDEVGGTAIEGLALFAQNRNILQDHFLDLPGSVHRVDRENAAYLYLHGGKPYLSSCWGGVEHSKFGSVSRGSVVD